MAALPLPPQGHVPHFSMLPLPLLSIHPSLVVTNLRRAVRVYALIVWLVLV
jgi:hypothetical protein